MYRMGVGVGDLTPRGFSCFSPAEIDFWMFRIEIFPRYGPNETLEVDSRNKFRNFSCSVLSSCFGLRTLQF